MKQISENDRSYLAEHVRVTVSQNRLFILNTENVT